ncbi:MAG: hypothetical protein WKG01_34490 [Kofleriaceae bacterium]
MGTDRTRIVALAGVALLACVASLGLMDWFRIDALFAINLRHIRVCPGQGVCATVDFGQLTGSFPLLATITFWGSVLFAAVVVFQAGHRLVNGHASEAISRAGTLVGVVMILTGAATAYVFGPDVGTYTSSLGALGGGKTKFVLERTWGPMLLILGHVVGIASLYFSSRAESDDRRPSPIPVATVVRSPSEVVPEPPKLAVERSQPISIPALVKGKLAFATVTAEVTRGGIDARREDGQSLLVIWRDVVGAVARRLPAELDADTFVDLVSTAGSTLRITSWTRLTGDAIEGVGETRARNLVKLVLGCCPELKLDRATREFVDGAEAAQLPDLGVLAQHDARLA